MMELTQPTQNSVSMATLQNLECNSCVHKNVCGYANVYVNIRSQIDDSIRKIVGDVPIFNVAISCKEFTQPTAVPRNGSLDAALAAQQMAMSSPQTLHNPLEALNRR